MRALPRRRRRRGPRLRRRSGSISYHPFRTVCGACPIQPDCAPSGIRTVERVFACIEHHDDLHRVRLRGRRGAGERFLLATTARNLKRMVRLRADQHRTRTPAVARGRRIEQAAAQAGRADQDHPPGRTTIATVTPADQETSSVDNGASGNVASDMLGANEDGGSHRQAARRQRVAAARPRWALANLSVTAGRIDPRRAGHDRSSPRGGVS